MTEYEITADASSINFAPASTTAEIIQNVRTILATRKGDVPLDREFGLSWDFLSLPFAPAKAKLSTEIIQQLKRYEPRAKVIRITLDESNLIDGQLKPRVVIGVNE